jgi:AraC family transcriptional regulator
MLSANVAVDTIRPFPGIATQKMYPRAVGAVSRPPHALSLVEVGTYGNRMAKHLHLAGAPMISVRTQRKANLAVTRLRSETALIDRTTPMPCERAFTVQLHLRPVSPVKFWLRGRPIPIDAEQPEGSVSIINLEHDPSLYLGGAFDMVQFYVPRAALDEFADENDACRCETLAWPFGKVDTGLRNLASCLVPVLERPELATELYVDHLVFAAHAYIARTYGGIKVAPSIVRGGLAPWQFQRATEMLRVGLPIRRASSGHFANC